MHTMRPEQMDAFREAERKNYMERLAVHIRTEFPEESTALGEDGLRDLIRSGVRKAAAHRIEEEPGVAKYVILTVGFGPRFEEEPWASAVLNNPEGYEPRLKAELLYDAGLEEARSREGIEDEE